MAGVLSTLDEDDAAKARIWIEEGMSPAGRLSPLVFANVALQADDIPFYAYEAGTRFDPGISSNEEAFALTPPRTIRNLPRRWTDGSAHTWTWRRSAVTSPRTARCMTTAIWTVPWIRASTELYSRDELVCLAGLDVGDDDACVMSGWTSPWTKQWSDKTIKTI